MLKSSVHADKETLVNKIKGCIYGQCIGDAVGLASEFLSREQCAYLYAGEEPLTYSKISRDMHRCTWLSGDWTDDTDQMFLILDSIFDNSGKVLIKDFAVRLKDWIKNGFPELGDKFGSGCGQTVRTTSNNAIFLEDPHKAAHEAWVNAQKNAAANGAVMRTSILGIINYENFQQVTENTLNICKVTHADPRCQASCIAVSLAIAAMLQNYSTDTPEDIGNLITFCYEKAAKLLPQESHQELKENIFATDLEPLDLDETGKIGYTYKCLGAAFYALATGINFEQIITEITYHAGDADTNCSVAGALLGCKLGFTGLPAMWVDNMPNKTWLDQKIANLLSLLKLA